MAGIGWVENPTIKGRLRTVIDFSDDLSVNPNRLSNLNPTCACCTEQAMP